MTVTSSGTNGFLFADLRDYTRYVEAHGDRAAASLLDAYRDARARGGRPSSVAPRSRPRATASTSSSPRRAAPSSAAWRSSMPRRSRLRRAARPIRVGIGVHAGETVETAEGYVGSAVNVAARVCSQAKPGELLVTDTVRALTRTFLPVQFVDRRARKLKGIEESVVLYRVEPAAVRGGPVAAKPVSGISRPVRTRRPADRLARRWRGRRIRAVSCSASAQCGPQRPTRDCAAGGRDASQTDAES